MSLNTFWQRSAKRRFKTKMRKLVQALHWRVCSWKDMAGNIIEEVPSVPACKLSDQPIVDVVTFAIPFSKIKVGASPKTAPTNKPVKDTITCEACLILYESFVEDK